MKNHHLQIVQRPGSWLALVLLLGLLLPASLVQAQNQPRIAVVDVERLQEESRLAVTLNEELRAFQNTMMTQLRQMQMNYEQGVTAIRELAPDSERFRTLRRELASLEAQLPAMENVARQEMNQMRLEANRRFISAVREATGSVARERQIAMVFRRSAPLPETVNYGDPQAVANFESRINQQGLLFADPSVDITSDVLVRMNEMFRGGQLQPQEQGQPGQGQPGQAGPETQGQPPVAPPAGGAPAGSGGGN